MPYALAVGVIVILVNVEELITESQKSSFANIALMVALDIVFG